LKHRVDSIESNLPKMIREMIDYYSDTKIKPILEKYLTVEQYREEIVNKLDYVMFNDYKKEQIQKEALNDKEFKTDERIFTIEQNVAKMVTKDEFKTQLKIKASNERLIELRENVHRLQVLSISNQDKYDNEMKRLDSQILKKTMDLDNTVHDIGGRLKALEEELEGEDEDGNSAAYRKSHASGIMKDGHQTGFTSNFSHHNLNNHINKVSGGEEDDVNIGEAVDKPVRLSTNGKVNVDVNKSLPNNESAEKVVAIAKHDSEQFGHQQNQFGE
jgi:hypothetical protein